MTDAERAQIEENRALIAYLRLVDEATAAEQTKLYPERPLAKVLPFKPRAAVFAVVLAVAASLTGISAPHRASAMPLPTPDPAPAGMQVTAAVDCSTFDIALSGLHDGQRVMVEIGNEPTYGFDTSGPHTETWQFTYADGTATASLPILANHQGTEFMTAIGIIDLATGVAVWPFYQWVDCTAAVDTPVVIEEAPAQIADPVVVTPEVATAYFASVELAPPW